MVRGHGSSSGNAVSVAFGPSVESNTYRRCIGRQASSPHRLRQCGVNCKATAFGGCADAGMCSTSDTRTQSRTRLHFFTHRLRTSDVRSHPRPSEGVDATVLARLRSASVYEVYTPCGRVRDQYTPDTQKHQYLPRHSLWMSGFQPLRPPRPHPHPTIRGLSRGRDCTAS